MKSDINELVSMRDTNPHDDQTIYKFNLTDRELEVLALLAEGLTNQQIAEKLSISQSTLKFA